MVSVRGGDGFSHGGNVFSRRGAACAEFFAEHSFYAPSLRRVGLGRCVSKLKSAEAFRAKLKERLPLGRLYVVLQAI